MKMEKAFLSYCCKDFGFLKEIFNLLEKNILYDKKDFVIGEISKDEMEKNIQACILFVVFISENSLNSDWVKFECEIAYSLNKKIMPIIIDDSRPDDVRIPTFIRNRNIGIGVCKRRIISIINNELRILNNDTSKSIKDSLFVGRNEEMRKIEDYFSENGEPSCIIANGRIDTGRKTTIINGLKKVGIIEQNSDNIIHISLTQNDNITSFYERINDAMLFSYDHKKNSNIQVSDIISIITKICHEKFFILIEDANCLIHHGGVIENWFIDVVKGINRFSLIVVSEKRPRINASTPKDKILFIEIMELPQLDRKALFNRYAEKKKVHIPDTEEKNIILEQLYGSINQIYHSVDLIEADGLKRVVSKRLKEISDYSKRICFDMVEMYNSIYGDNFVDFMVFLSKYPFISYNFIQLIEKEINVNLTDYIEILIDDSICVVEGRWYEYVRMNETVSFTLRRYKPLNEQYKNLLKKNAEEFLKASKEGYDVYDLSETRTYIYSLLMSNSIDYTDSTIGISLLVQAVRDSYYDRKDYDRVIELCRSVLSRITKFDTYIEQDMRYFMCMSLAKKKDKDFFNQIGYLQRDKNFLYGFYYRHIGNFEKAIEYQKKALGESSERRARKELVISLCALERYDEAFVWSKTNFEKEPQNPLFALDYFSCVMHENKQNTLENLKAIIKELSINKNEKAIEIVQILNARIEMYFYDNYNKAVSMMDDLLKQSKRIYPLIEKLCFAMKKLDKDMIETTLSDIKKISDTPNINVEKAKIILTAMSGNIEEALIMVERSLKMLSTKKRSEFIDIIYSIK